MNCARRNFPPPDPLGVVLTQADRRAQALRLEQEWMEERQRRLAQQASTQNTPQERIRIWEEIHGLDLPQSRTHKLLWLIATQTALTVQQVRDEQQRRGTPAPAPVSVKVG